MTFALGGNRVISPSICSAVVAMVIVTAMVAWSLARRTRKTEELLE